jgi:hypothetical protein
MKTVLSLPMFSHSGLENLLVSVLYEALILFPPFPYTVFVFVLDKTLITLICDLIRLVAAVDAGVKTQVIIDLEADENLYERGGQTAIIDLEADDARNTLRVQHKTNNTLRRGLSPPTCAWYYMDPQGEEQGPFAIEHLRDWWHSNYFPENFKVWREGQTSDSAVFLRDVLY